MDARQTPDRDEKIRQIAHRIWMEEGQPEGRADIHWDMATELLAQQEGYADTLQPVTPDAGEPEEPAALQDNLGEFPTLTDQGEQSHPRRRSTDI
ncbi:DUF2934 domain-containing protein [Xanthobacteraceae bacterium A53D]